MTKRRQTFDEFELHSMIPSLGWQAIFFDDSKHFVLPVYTLALASRCTYDVETRQQVFPRPSDNPLVLREIVGVIFFQGEGFSVADESSNFCDLLPPGVTLQEYEESETCGHRSPQEEMGTT